MSMPFDATMKGLVQKFSSDYQVRFHLESQEPLHLINVDLSTVTASAAIVLADGDPPRLLYHLEFQSSHMARFSPRTLLHNALLHFKYRVPVHSMVILLRSDADGPGFSGGVEYETRAGRG